MEDIELKVLKADEFHRITGNANGEISVKPDTVKILKTKRKEEDNGTDGIS